MKKLFLLLSITSSLPVFAITPAITNFKTLPEYVHKYAKAVVTFRVTTANKIEYCTGVAISENRILTAAHCLATSNDAATGYIDKKKITTIDTISNPLSTTEKLFLNNDIEKITDKDNKEKKLYNLSYINDDYAILALKGLNKSNYVKAEDLLENQAELNQFLSANGEETDKIIMRPYVSGYNIYIFGAQDLIFQWNTFKTNNDTLYFASYNTTERYGTGNYFTSKNTGFALQKGDSGGPQFLCNQTQCKLLGISILANNNASIGLNYFYY